MINDNILAVDELHLHNLFNFFLEGRYASFYKKTRRYRFLEKPEPFWKFPRKNYKKFVFCNLSLT